MDVLYLGNLMSAKRIRLEQLQRFLRDFRELAPEDTHPHLKRAAYFSKSVDDDSDDYVGRNIRTMLGGELVSKQLRGMDSATKVLLTAGVPAIGAIGVGAVTSNVTMGALAGIFMSILMSAVLSQEALQEIRRMKKSEEKTSKEVKAKRRKFFRLTELLWELSVIQDEVIEELYEELLMLQSSIDPLEYPSHRKLIDECIDEMRSLSPEYVASLFRTSASIVLALLSALEELSLPSDLLMNLKFLRAKLVRYVKLFKELREILRDDEMLEFLSEVPTKPVELPESVERQLLCETRAISSYINQGNISLVNLPLSIRRAALHQLDDKQV